MRGSRMCPPRTPAAHTPRRSGRCRRPPLHHTSLQPTHLQVSKSNYTAMNACMLRALKKGPRINLTTGWALPLDSALPMGCLNPWHFVSPITKCSNSYICGEASFADLLSLKSLNGIWIVFSCFIK